MADIGSILNKNTSNLFTIISFIWWLKHKYIKAIEKACIAIFYPWKTKAVDVQTFLFTETWEWKTISTSWEILTRVLEREVVAQADNSQISWRKF